MKVTCEYLDDFTFRVEDTATGMVHRTDNVAVILNDADDRCYLSFSIPSLGIHQDVMLPLSFFEQQETGYRNLAAEPKYGKQDFYSESFHKNEDESAAFFRAAGHQLDLLGVFSVSQYAHERLSSAQSGLDSTFSSDYEY